MTHMALFLLGVKDFDYLVRRCRLIVRELPVRLHVARKLRQRTVHIVFQQQPVHAARLIERVEIQLLQPGLPPRL